MNTQYLLIDELPNYITVDCREIFDNFHADVRKMTIKDFDIGDILGMILKAIEYPDPNRKELQYQIGVLHEDMITLRTNEEFDNDRDRECNDFNAYADANILADAIEYLTDELDNIFNNPIMRGKDGRLNYYINQIERENTILFSLRNCARKPKLLEHIREYERV